MKRLVIHGGAGDIPDDRADAIRRGLLRALEAGWARMSHATDAVEAAIRTLELDGNFDAGLGSVLNIRGRVEMDAALMTHDRRVGAVANLTRYANPISVARKVMEETDHVLLSGTGADRFARVLGFQPVRIHSEARRKRFRELRQQLAVARHGSREAPSRALRLYRRLPRLLARHPRLAYGTVGAVALDSSGRLTAGTSTGGVFLKLEGRVSDSCLPGCGTYADETVGVSATGWGEEIIRHTLGRSVAEAMKTRSCHPTTAIEMVLARMPPDTAGAIALDRRGRLGIAHNTPNLAWASQGSGSRPRFGLTAPGPVRGSPGAKDLETSST
jgi:beta-aspartyl-peptidase (threonine type)